MKTLLLLLFTVTIAFSQYDAAPQNPPAYPSAPVVPSYNPGVWGTIHHRRRHHRHSSSSSDSHSHSHSSSISDSDSDSGSDSSSSSRSGHGKKHGNKKKCNKCRDIQSNGATISYYKDRNNCKKAIISCTTPRVSTKIGIIEKDKTVGITTQGYEPQTVATCNKNGEWEAYTVDPRGKKTFTKAGCFP